MTEIGSSKMNLEQSEKGVLRRLIPGECGSEGHNGEEPFKNRESGKRGSDAFSCLRSTEGSVASIGSVTGGLADH